MITKIIQKYEGFTNSWYPEVTEDSIYKSPDLEKYKKESKGEEQRLLNKYKNYIPKGWYGFSFGEPTPKNWFLIVDEFLEYLISLQDCQKKISGLEIHQIKMKFGGLRFYVSYICHDEEHREFIDLQISKLESHCFDKKLIY